MASGADGFADLSPRHGCKCMPPDDSISVEDVLETIAAEVGSGNIVSASRMNRAVVFFLKEIVMVDSLVQAGITVKDQFLSVLPLSNPSKKVILSNVPPFIPDPMLTSILGRYGRIISPLRKIPLGLRNPDLKHVMSFRRQTLMIMKPEFEKLDVSVKLSIAGKDYMIFISNDSMRCFGCGKPGHVKQECQAGKEADRSGVGPGSAPSPEAPPRTADTPQPGAQTDSQNAAPEPPQAADVPQTGGHTVSQNVPPVPTESESPTGTESGVVTEVVQAQEEEHASAAGPDPASAEVGSVSGERVNPESQMQHEVQSEENLASEANDVQFEDFSDCESDGSDMSQEDNAAGEVDGAAKKSKRYYSVTELNNFLDLTFGKRNVKIDNWFPNLELFVESCAMAMRTCTREELDQQKRYRIDKIVAAVKRQIKQRRAAKRRRRR